MYRILDERAPVRERRNQRKHPEYSKPELVATAPNQVWSWDITKLLGPQKWTYYYLYVLLDIFSRYVVGWMVADRENSALAGRLITETCDKHGVEPTVLTLHSDRGSPMTSKSTSYCRGFFPWYNDEHRHGGIAMLTPADVHYGRAEIVLATRQAALDAAFAAHPERFPNGRPTVKSLPEAVYINPPKNLLGTSDENAH